MRSLSVAGALVAVAAVGSAQAALTDNRFNPAVSLILQGKLNSYSENPDDYVLPGFQLGGEAGLADDGLSLDESELTLSANVDQAFFAQATVGLHDDGGSTEVDMEEAYVDTLALPAGLGLRFGRFYSGIGYLNRFHSHAWDFHDEPLVYRALLGGQLRDDGVRATWVAPTDLFIQVGAETLRGDRFPGGGSKQDFGDAQSLFLKLGGDFDAANAWQFGLSALWENPRDREGGGHAHGDAAGPTVAFTGDSTLYGADFVWKWAPDGNPTQRNFIFQAEFFRRDEGGNVIFTEATNAARLAYDGTQYGWYAQGVYQFMPRWRVGLRYDRLSADNRLRVADLGGFADPDEVLSESGLLDAGHEPARASLMFDWSPSEFSRLRLQYSRDDSRPDATDHQVTLQYIMSLGAHGAHEF